MEVLTYIGYILIIFCIIVAPATIWFAICAAKLNKAVSFGSWWATEYGNTFNFLQRITANKQESGRYGLFNRKKITFKESESVYNMIEHDLKAVFGDDYRCDFDLTKDYSATYQTPKDCIQWANRLLLAKDGLMLSKDTSPVSGFEIGYETCEWNVALCNIIESYLIEQHPDDKDNIALRMNVSYANVDDGKYSGNMTLGIYDYKKEKECRICEEKV